MRSLLLFIVLACTCVSAEAQLFGRKVIKASEAEIADRRIRSVAVDAAEIAAGRADQLVTAAALKAALDALPERDTANYRVRVLKDSILVYYVDNREVGRDTVRGQGGGPGGLQEVARSNGLVGRGTTDDPIGVDFQAVASRIFAQNMATAARQEAEGYANVSVARAEVRIDSLDAALSDRISSVDGIDTDTLPVAIDRVLGTSSWRTGGQPIGEHIVNSWADLQGALAQDDTVTLVIRGAVFLPEDHTTIPDYMPLRRVGGYFFTSAGDTLTVLSRIKAEGREFLQGNGRYRLISSEEYPVQTDWFSEYAGDGLVEYTDTTATIISVDHEPYAHVMRRAMVSASWGGTRKDWHIRVNSGIHITEDAGEAVRSAYAGEGYVYRESPSALSTYASIDGPNGSVYELYSHGNIELSPNTLLLPPEGSYAAWDMAPYRKQGYDWGIDKIWPYEETGEYGDRVMRLKVAPPADVFQWGQAISWYRGSSYGDQTDGDAEISEGISPNNPKLLRLRYGLSRPLATEKSSYYGKLLEDFVQPSGTDTVTVRISENPPLRGDFLADPERFYGKDGVLQYFSLGNDLYKYIRRGDGPNEYVITGVEGKGNKPAGTLIPAGTNQYYARIVMPAPTTVQNVIVTGPASAVVYGRRDGFRPSNVINMVWDGPTMAVARTLDNDGQWANADGYREVTFKNCRLFSASRWMEGAQPARGGTGFHLINVTTAGLSLDASEFTSETTIDDSYMSLDLKNRYHLRDGQTNDYLLNFGKTTAYNAVRNSTLVCLGCDAILEGKDIVEKNATAGGGLEIKNVTFHADAVKGFSFGPTNVTVDGLYGTGRVREVFAALGPSIVDTLGGLKGVQEDNHVIWSRTGYPEIENATFRGRFNRGFGGEIIGGHGELTAYWEGTYEGDSEPVPSGYSRGNGMGFDRSNGSGYRNPKVLDYTLTLHDFPLLKGEDYIRYEPELADDHRLRVRLIDARITDKNNNTFGYARDTTFCKGNCDGLEGVSELELTQNITAVKTEILAGLDTLVLGGSRRYEIAPSSIAWQRRIDYIDTLRTRQLYRFHIDLKHTSDHIYAAPYHPAMVITDIDVDVQQDRTISEGTFYLARPGSLRLLTKVWDHSDQTIEGGHITITNMGNADLMTYPRDRYYYDVVSQGPREVREQRFALVKENWNRFASAYQDSVIFGLTSRPDVAPGPDAWLNTPSLDVDESRFVEIEIEVLDYNAGDLSMTSVAVASGADLTGTIARERMFDIVEHTEGVYHVKIPEGLDRIGSIGFYYEGPGTQSSTTNARTMVRIISVKLVDRLADLNSGDTPNSIVLLRDFKRASPGTTLDYAFLPIPFHQTLTMNEANGLTIRNLHLYDTKNRINNRGQSQHFFSAGSSQNVELTRAQIWGYHDRRLYKVEGGGTRYDVPMNVGDTVVYNVTDEGRNSTTARIWEDDRGPVYRVDVSNMEVGDTFRILSERDSGIIHEHIAVNADLQVVYYDRKNVLERMLWSATGEGQQQLVLKVYGHIRHVYGDEFQAGLIAGGGAKNWNMDYYHGEMMQGDGFQIQPGAQNITIDHATLYGMGRMGWSANGGENVVVRNTDAFNAGRSTIDLEPYAFGWLLDGMRVDNVRVGGYNFNGWISANWSRIRNLHVDGFYDLGKGTLDSQGGNTWNGGAINSTFTNLYGYRFGFRGLNMTIDSISGTKLNIEAGESKPDDATGGRMIAGTVPSLMRRWELRPRYFSPNYQINIEGEGTIAVDGRIRADEFLGFESGTDYASLIRQDKGGKILSYQNDLYDLLFPAMVKGREAKPLKGIPDVSIEYNLVDLYDLPAGTYQISVGVVLGDSTEYVFPNSHTFVTDGTEGTIRIRPVDLFDVVNGRIYYEWNVYVESGGHDTYEKVYRLRMNDDFAGIDETPGFDLYGDTLRVSSTSDPALLYGYPTNEDGDVVVAASIWERAAGEYQAPGGVQKISFDDGVVRLSGGGGEFPLSITTGPSGPSATEGKQPRILVDAAGRGDFVSIQAAMDSVARAAAAGRVLPRIYITSGNYVEALVAPCSGIQLFGIGASPGAVRISAPTNRTSDNLVKSVYPSFRMENMTLYTDVEDSSLDFLSFTGADVDSIIIRDIVLVTTGRVDLFVEATNKVYSSFLIDNMRTRGADGPGDNGGVTGREGMTVVNSYFEGENVVENNQGGKFENCYFGGKVDIKEGQFMSCTFGEAVSSLYQGTIDGNATFDRCTFTRYSNGANCTLVEGGAPLFIDCKFMSTYEGGGSAARALDVTGGTPTLLGGQIVVVNDEGYAIGNSGGTLTAPRLLGTTIVGPIETATVDVDVNTFVVPGRNDMNIYPRPFPVTGQTEATYTTTLSGADAYTVAAALDCIAGTPTGNETIQTYRTSDGNVAIKLGNLDPDNTYRPIIIGGTSSLE